MKYLICSVSFAILIGLSVGYYYKNNTDEILGNRIIGIAVLGIAFIFFPLFIYYRYRNKNIRDFELFPRDKEKNSSIIKIALIVLLQLRLFTLSIEKLIN